MLAGGDPVADRGVNEREKKLDAFKHGAAQEEREGGKAVLVILLVGLGLFGLIAFGIWSAAR